MELRPHWYNIKKIAITKNFLDRVFGGIDTGFVRTAVPLAL